MSHMQDCSLSCKMYARYESSFAVPFDFNFIFTDCWGKYPKYQKSFQDVCCLVFIIKETRVEKRLLNIIVVRSRWLTSQGVVVGKGYIWISTGCKLRGAFT